LAQVGLRSWTLVVGCLRLAYSLRNAGLGLQVHFFVCVVNLNETRTYSSSSQKQTLVNPDEFERMLTDGDIRRNTESDCERSRFASCNARSIRRGPDLIRWHPIKCQVELLRANLVRVIIR